MDLEFAFKVLIYGNNRNVFQDGLGNKPHLQFRTTISGKKVRLICEFLRHLNLKEYTEVRNHSLLQLKF